MRFELLNTGERITYIRTNTDGTKQLKSALMKLLKG